MKFLWLWTVLGVLSLADRVRAKDIDVLIFSPQEDQYFKRTRLDLVKVSEYLNTMLSSTDGYEGSSSQLYSSQFGVACLADAYHNPNFSAATRGQVTGDYDYVVLVPYELYAKNYPEMVFEGVYQLSREIQETGAEPILLMGNALVAGDVARLSENMYRVANGCGVRMNPAGQVLGDEGLLNVSGLDKQRQSYVVAASLYHQITGLDAGDLQYEPVADADDLAQKTVDHYAAQKLVTQYTTSVHDQGIVRYRTLDLSAGPLNGVARFCYKGTSTETGIRAHMLPILQANGFATEYKLVSTNTGGVKYWNQADFNLAKPFFDARDDQVFLAYGRGGHTSSADMIAYDQGNLLPLTFDRHNDDIGSGTQSTQYMLSDLFEQSNEMYKDYVGFGWNTVPYHVGAARLYQQDQTVVASSDGVHASTPFYHLLCSMLLTSSLGQDLEPSATIANNAQSLLAYDTGKLLVKQWAFISETGAFVPDSLLEVVRSRLKVGTTGVAYSQELEAVGGVGGLTWSVNGQMALPVGMSLSAGGVLSGVPSEAVDRVIVFRVTDSLGAFRKLPMRLMVQDVANSSYAAWASFVFDNSGVPAADQAAQGDPDGDGLSNLVEYALGNFPLGGVDPNVFSIGSGLELQFLRGRSGLTYSIEQTEDLGDWSEAETIWSSEVGAQNLVEVGALQKVFLTDEGALRLFYRLKITE